MKPVIDHIHVTVADLERAERFYDRLLPLLGFDLANKERDVVPEHEYGIVEYHHSSFSFGIVSPRPAYTSETISRRKPGALHHLAFHADSRAEADRLYLQVKALGAEIVHEPRLYPEYCKDYYAFFFKDSEGIEYEIVHFDRAGCFPLERGYT
jgi:catechol 2,3-dioxygenase-like lactoylglutathione lyase family enzyme